MKSGRELVPALIGPAFELLEKRVSTTDRQRSPRRSPTQRGTSILALSAVTLLAASASVPSLAATPSNPALQADRVEVRKADRLLLLYRGGTELARFQVALGGSPVGPKRCQGDQKTPEGRYRITGHYPKSEYHLALHVSYPNADDRKASAALHCPTGGDIYIHGLPNGQGAIGAAHRLRDWTLGCIALTDPEIEEIAARVPDGTVLDILP